MSTTDDDLGEYTHRPCCSAHGVAMTCVRYRRTHFVEVRPCCSADALTLAAERAAADELTAVTQEMGLYAAEDDHPANARPEPTEEEAAAVWGPRDVDDAGPEESR